MSTDDVLANLGKLQAAMEAGAARGALLGGQHLLRESRILVPHEEGTLERSGKVTTDGPEAAVSFDTPYAVKQHEDLTLRHDDGRTAKYLERPMHEQSDTVAQIGARAVARSIKKALS